MLREFKESFPEIAKDAYVDPDACLIGRVSLSKGASVWPGTVLRGDVEEIKIGENSNIQDLTAVHTNYDLPAVVGNNCTVGHNAVLHGCVIGNYCLIGMGAIILDGVKVEDGTIVAAGALVPEGKKLEGGFVYMGIPAKKVRAVTPEEKSLILTRAGEYRELAACYNR